MPVGVGCVSVSIRRALASWLLACREITRCSTSASDDLLSRSPRRWYQLGDCFTQEGRGVGTAGLVPLLCELVQVRSPGVNDFVENLAPLPSEPGRRVRFVEGNKSPFTQLTDCGGD